MPSAGPYYIADHLNGEYTILKRNPNYTGPRPHAFDAIALREGVDPGVAVGLVERGSWDGIVHVFDPLLTPTGPVAEEYGGRGHIRRCALVRRGRRKPLTRLPRIQRGPPGVLRPGRAPRGVRSRSTGSPSLPCGERATDQLLPPVMPGFVDRELYPLDGSGLDEARALMDGRRATAVFGVARGNDHARQEAEIVRADPRRSVSP